MQNPSPERSRLLLIEDDDADAVLVERALERFPGFELRHVTRMEAAFDLLNAEPIDVALLDLSLPDSFGLEGVTALQKRFPDLAVVVLTGLDDRELPLEALERGAQDYLCKGQCSPEILFRTLRYAIQRQQIQGENRRLLGELARQARCDALTGILNRRSLVAELAREWQLAARSGKPLSCVLFDLDLFKRINDTHGHSSGDLVLQAVATLLTAVCRTTDVAGRYGGEEFLVVLPDTNETGALDFAQRLRREIAATPLAVGNASIHVTASFGVAEKATGVLHAEQLLDRADQALRMSKQLGRDQVVSYEQTLSPSDDGEGDPQDAFAKLIAGDIMTPLVATLEESTTLQEATEFLLNLRLDSAPIVDDQGRVVGIIGEEDLAHVLSSAEAWQRPVAELMRKRPVCFTAETPATVIHDFLSRAGLRRVAILSDRRPVGIVSRASMLRWRENQGFVRRSALARLTPDNSTASERQAHLLALAAEIERQATRLADRLLASCDEPVELTVATATRIQLLLDDAVAQSQRLESYPVDRATICAMV